MQLKKRKEFSTAQHVVRVTLTGDLPEGVDRVRRVGPYENELAATEAARVFDRIAYEMGWSEAVRIEVVDGYRSTVEHLDPCPPDDFEALAELIGPDFVRGRLVAFPDLYDRLVAAHGFGKADWAWRQALALILCKGGAVKPAAADQDLDPFREKVKAASKRLVEPFAPPILNDAALLLRDLVTAATGHGVDLDRAARHLAPFALEEVAGRVTAAARQAIAA